MAAAPPRRFVDNPFLILAADPEQPRVELEREGQKLLGMLGLGLRSAATYATPVGPQARTPEAVRAALAEIRVPERRLLHELWASFARAPASAESPVDPAAAAAAAAATSAGDPFRAPERGGERAPPEAAAGEPEAFAIFGWRRR